MTAFLNSFTTETTDGTNKILNEIEQEARKDAIPVIRRETQSLLKLLLAMKQPERILEIGTAVGFSSIFMSVYNPVPSQITTIENYEPRITAAKANFARSGTEQTITLLEGDANKILKTLTASYDFIFMDAAKGQYIYFLPAVMQLLADGGTLVSDNVLQEGDILESRFGVMRRNRTIHKRMREYLYQLTHDERLTTVILPVGDGVTISEKRSSYEKT
jgi:predicted O-methyltransferase YrrM